MNFKKLAALILSAALLVSAAACAPVGVAPETNTEAEEKADSEKEESTEPQKLTMGIWGIESVVKAHEIACDGINEAIPEISEMELVVYPTDTDFFANLPTQIASGTAPDIVKCDYTYMYEYIQKGYFQALDESVLELDPYTKEGVDAFRVDGQLYGLPINAQPLCMAINLDLWEEAGLTDIPNTWEDIEAAGEALAAIGKPALIFDNNINFVSSVIMGFGGGWNRAEDMNTPENQEGIDTLLDAFKKGYVVTASSLGYADSSAAFCAGEAAMVTAGPWYNSVMSSGAPDTKFALIKLPCKSLDLRSYSPTIDGYFVVKGADPELATKALNYVDRKEFQEAFYNGVGAMMSNLEVREFYFDKYPTAENLKDAMEYIGDLMLPAEATEFANIVTTEVGKAIADPNSELTGEDIINNIQAQYDAVAK